MKGKYLAITAIGLTGILQACGGRGGEASQAGEEAVEHWRAELMQADRLFAETIEREGLSKWGSFFAADGAVIREGTGEIRGVEAIQASMDAAAGAVTSFTWTPDRADVSEGGDLGYTVGHYRTAFLGPDSAEMVSTGMYVSIWRRQADGSWKVEMDLGNPLTGPKPLEPGGPGGGGR